MHMRAATDIFVVVTVSALKKLQAEKDEDTNSNPLCLVTYRLLPVIVNI